MRAAGAAPCAAVPVSAAATVVAAAAHPKLERRRLTLDGASPCSCAAAAGGAPVSWLEAAAQLARRARVAKTAAAATPLKEGAALAAPLAALALAPRTLRLRCTAPRRGGGAGEESLSESEAVRTSVLCAVASAAVVAARVAADCVWATTCPPLAPSCASAPHVRRCRAATSTPSAARTHAKERRMLWRLPSASRSLIRARARARARARVGVCSPRRGGVREGVRPADRAEHLPLLHRLAHAQLLQLRRRQTEQRVAAQVGGEGGAELGQPQVGDELAAVVRAPLGGGDAGRAAGGELSVHGVQRRELCGASLMLPLPPRLLDALLAARPVRLEQRRQLEPCHHRQRRLARVAAPRGLAARLQLAGTAAAAGLAAAAAAAAGSRASGLPQLRFDQSVVARERSAQGGDRRRARAAAGHLQHAQGGIALKRGAEVRAAVVAERAAAEAEPRQAAAGAQCVRERCGAPRAHLRAAQRERSEAAALGKRERERGAGAVANATAE